MPSIGGQITRALIGVPLCLIALNHGFQSLFKMIQSSIGQKFIRRQVDILDDLAQQRRRDIAAPVNRNSGSPTVRVPKLLMRTPLPYLNKTQLQ